MSNNWNIKNLFAGEARMFIVLWLIYLVLPYLVVPDRFGYTLGTSELIIKSSYLLPILFNNYVLIPRLLHKGRYLIFTLICLGLMVGSSFIEELILEEIFYPDTRGGGLSLGGLRSAMFKIGFAYIFFGSFKLVWDYQKKQQQIGELEKEKIESELKFLKSQINPHVLFNNLNNIYSYALEKSDKVPQMILKLSELMRYMLREGTAHLVSLEKELDYLGNFVELQKLRLEGRGDVTFSIEGEPNEYKIAPLLLVSFVENSFKHSMQSEVDDIDITIVAKIENGKLIFDARNTFSEQEQRTVIPGENGIGLQNVKKRLELMYKDRYELHLEKEDGYFIARLTLDLSVNENDMPDHRG